MKKPKDLPPRCPCKAWSQFIKESRPITTIAHIHGINYAGPVFRICPFCGKKLKESNP